MNVGRMHVVRLEKRKMLHDNKDTGFPNTHKHTHACVPNDFSTQTLKKIKLLSDSGALAPSGFQGKCVVRQELILRHN